MPGYDKQMQHEPNEARRLLRERLARKAMGDEAYDRMVSSHDDRDFKLFGAVFIALFAAAVLITAWLGY
ncbi:hypothetical protein [Bosea sp. ANAM02]|uniref:hypothetical protein n=1 Tax=Bosea sp. ANAM02 TaxID=2020412 RepID=UPI00140EB49D|nr:hypothetical protein [Bosea sp. ANAM02]BCB20673.1 hypothetical protein OCUBac02_35670 [Bosea sp. ANAM02]